MDPTLPFQKHYQHLFNFYNVKYVDNNIMKEEHGRFKKYDLCWLKPC